MAVAFAMLGAVDEEAVTAGGTCRHTLDTDPS